MSKYIFDEAKTILEDICIDFDEHGYVPTIPSHRDSDLHFYTIYKKEIDKIDEALEKAQDQEKLLELYEALVIVKDDMLSYCEVVDDDYYDSKELATSFEKQIKEKENEIKRFKTRNGVRVKK